MRPYGSEAVGSSPVGAPPRVPSLLSSSVLRACPGAGPGLGAFLPLALAALTVSLCPEPSAWQPPCAGGPLWSCPAVSCRAAETGGQQWTCAGASSRPTAKATARAGCPPATRQTRCRYSPFGRHVVLWSVVTGGRQGPGTFHASKNSWKQRVPKFGIPVPRVQSRRETPLVLPFVPTQCGPRLSHSETGEPRDPAPSLMEQAWAALWSQGTGLEGLGSGA